MKHFWVKGLALCLVAVLSLTPLCGCQSEDGRKKIEYESAEQQAVVETALGYLNRGSRIQYADTRLTLDEIAPSGVRYRWQKGVNSPEDATTQYYTYTNCAAFTYDVYYEALDFDILSYTTASLIQSAKDIMMYKYFPTGNETEEEMATVEQEIRSQLKMGDIIVVRYNGSRKGNGHAMLYVGPDVLENVIADKNNLPEGDTVATTAPTSSVTEKAYVYDIIHSSGSNYNYGNYAERFEEKGSISMTSVDMLFDPTSSRYVFSKLLSVGIVRPLNRWSGGVPEKTQNRINNMYGIVAEKLSSHTVGMTVNPGDEITFTFSVQNTNPQAVSLEVKDMVPDHTTYVSGAETVDGKNLSWNVTVPAGETKRVSYTVLVDVDASYGDVIHGQDGTVGGVDTDCKPITVANTLSAEQQQTLLAKLEAYRDTELRGMALANTIYAETTGTEDLLPDSAEQTLAAVFTNYLGVPTHFSPVTEGHYADMIVPTMYGGRYTLPPDGVEGLVVRTRLPYKPQVMTGDILLLSDNNEGTMVGLYLLAGDKAYDLLSEDLTSEAIERRLEKTIAYNRFVILRPSMAIQDK